MTVSVTHSTPADSSFFPEGAAAWDDNHNITGLANAVAFFDSAGALADSALLTFDPSAKQLLLGSTGTSAGLRLGYYGASGYAAIYNSGLSAGAANYALLQGVNGDTYLNSASGQGLRLRINNADIILMQGTDIALGRATSISAGTATTDVNALSLTQTWNAAGVAFTGLKFTITDTASAAGALAMQILGGASGTTNLLSLTKGGALTLASSLSCGAITGTNIEASATAAFFWTGRTQMRSPEDGIISFANQAASSGAALQIAERTAPSGTTNAGRIYCQDNGAGKTQLMVIFGSGAAQQIAIEP